MPCSLILRKYKSSEKKELTFDNVENVESISVEALRERASSELKIDPSHLRLVFGGRVLKVGKTVADYKVVPGCTIYAMDIKPNSRTKEQASAAPAQGRGLMNNRRMLSLIGRVISNPAVLQDVAQGIGMATGNPAILQLLGNQQLLSGFSNPDNIQQYIQDNPDVAAMMEQVIQQMFGGSVEGMVGAEQDEDRLVDFLENHLEGEMAQLEREREEEGEMEIAQEQMFEHSQALHAHQQQSQQGHASSSTMQETSYNPLTSQQHGSVTMAARQNSGNAGLITQDQLSSALAGALSSSSSPWMSSSPLASLNQATPPQRSASSEYPPPPHSTPLQQQFSTSSSYSQPNVVGGASGGVSAPPGPISAASLQQALASVAHSTGSRAPTGPQDTGGIPLASRYRVQLEQLRLMGIQDETACLHALAATGGDLQAALEILYSQ